jgi:hypothetical protein
MKRFRAIAIQKSKQLQKYCNVLLEKRCVLLSRIYRRQSRKGAMGGKKSKRLPVDGSEASTKPRIRYKSGWYYR